MSRPLSFEAKAFIELVSAAPLPAYRAAEQLKMELPKVAVIASNLKRAGYVAEMGTQKREGACKPVMLYQEARAAAAAKAARGADEQPWFIDLGAVSY